MQAAFHSTIPELRSFVNTLCQDQAAVQAGLTLKWKNGMVEGHMLRLKFLKRSMYGRANLISCGYGFCIIKSVPEPVI